MPRLPKEKLEKLRQAWIYGLVDGSFETVQDIATFYKVNRQALYTMAKRHGWDKEKEEAIELARKIVARDRQTRLVPLNQEGTEIKSKVTALEWIDSHVKLGKKMMKRGETILDNTPDNRIDLDQATRLIEKGADIERKAVTPKEEPSGNVVVNLVSLWKIINDKNGVETIEQ